MTPTTTVSTAPRSAEIVYPTSDGRPMGETDLHRNIMFASIESLKLHYAGQQVYVSGNILLQAEAEVERLRQKLEALRRR